ncbi:MAG: CHASE3 domain-containing protein [Acidobacteriaceae bacterium]|nr:CHASE3 domain-containing protein [Acidobacteriaceae bacterium]
MTVPAHKKTRQRLAALFSVPLAFSLIYFFVNQAGEQRETRLLEVLRLAGCMTQLRAHARDAEAGERGFYLTGEERYLLPFKQAQQSLPDWIRQSLAYARERPEYRAEVNKIIELVHERFREAASGISEKQKAQLTSESLATHLTRGQDTMDNIRAQVRGILQKLNSEELAILDTQQTFSRWTFLFFSVGSLIMIGVIVWLYNALLRYIYERDAAEENLKTVNTYLEARIEERTRDLTHANEELQQFAYVASHDLQEPLRTITSFTQLLAVRYRGRLDADADEFIGYIVSSSRRMTDLINGLLALVRLRKAGQPTTPVSFEELLSQAEISLQAAIRESQARIEHGPLPSLVVDSVQFSQVLQNLISNAIKYRREETPVIEVEAYKDSSNWIFSVRDNGRGFDPQFAERIFGLFQRLHNREEGTGMGLSISRKIVERHGGRMWAESNEGDGSTFFFSLPVSLENTRDRAEATESNPIAQAK